MDLAKYYFAVNNSGLIIIFNIYLVIDTNFTYACSIIINMQGADFIIDE